MSDWGPFLQGELGASAALAGLLFVAISLNMTKILAFPSLPNRALQALVLLFAIVLATSYLLVPGLDDLAQGAGLLAIGVVVGYLAAHLGRASVRGAVRPYLSATRNSVLLGVGAAAAYIAAGAVVLTLGTVGLYLLVLAVVLSFLDAIIDSWVLLVEINR